MTFTKGRKNDDRERGGGKGAVGHRIEMTLSNHIRMLHLHTYNNICIYDFSRVKKVRK